jgi:hypothetical protein
MLFAQAFHRHGPTTLFTRSTNQGLQLIQTIIEQSWWATLSLSSMLQPFIFCYPRSLRGDTFKLEGKHRFKPESTKPLIISSHSKPSLRRPGTDLQKSFVALLTFKTRLTQSQGRPCSRDLETLASHKVLITAIMCLYESVLGKLYTIHEVSNFIKSTIGVK